MTPDDMTRMAHELATMALGLPESVRDEELNDLRTKNEAMYTLVKAAMSDLRRRARPEEN